MMGSPVSLVSFKEDRDNLKNTIATAVESVCPTLEKKVRTVVIKPNLCYYWEASTGCTTDPRLISAMIDYLRERFGRDIEITVAEADASAMRTDHVFQMLGYQKLADEKNVKLFNLSKDNLIKKKVTVNGHDIELDVPQSLMSADLFINVPKLKMMRVTKITCAMKNIFGCIGLPRKFVYHRILEETIVGINKILKPNLTVVDGLVALGRFPIKLGLVMGSTDVFSIDFVAAKIAGYNPKKVGFLSLAMKEKLGNPEGISLRGERLEYFRRRFPREGLLSQKWLWSLQFGALRAYKKVSGDVIPPFLEEE